MNLQLRFNLILGSLLLGFCAVLMLLNHFSNQAEARYQDENLADQGIYLNHWVNTEARSWVQDARELAHHITTKTGGETPSNPWVRLAKIAADPDAPQTLGIDRDGNLAVAGPGRLRPERADFLQPGSALVESLNREGGWFYTYVEEAFFQICYAPVWGDASHSTSGWLLLIRPWDSEHIDYLANLSGGKIQLFRNNASEAGQTKPNEIMQALRDWRGELVSNLVMEIVPPNPQAIFAEAILPTLLLLAFGLLVVLALAISLQKWVLGPLQLVQQSLATGEIAPIEPLRDRRDELGGVAGLLATSIEQRKALHESEAKLQSALEERIRLGRDLHDSVIQSLYATGMGLAVVKDRLNEDQKDVTMKLEQSRSALNETILDLRNFITGLEPEALKKQTFTEAVMHLLDFASDMRPVKSTCDIDDELAEKLSLSQRANILQITREALSNALRHGAATEITVSLQTTPTNAEFEISDNGRGFDPKSNLANGGHGLENLAGRARDIGARMTLHSVRGEGTRMKLIFALPREGEAS